MNQYECDLCGYDLTPIESFANRADYLGYASSGLNNYSEIYPISLAYASNNINSVECPNCGRLGCWIKE
ncbi:hypothetical protein [Candidatus Epulonipiscium viviparus]|uniref:hypothetical protein n=1 Tax=Candidatus Epulonipiscium viviparus TaxID=420336 RepID=UPI00016C08C2|nr:hypothetical protein [Candidatus Epulopiscium viviparus]